MPVTTIESQNVWLDNPYGLSSASGNLLIQKEDGLFLASSNLPIPDINQQLSGYVKKTELTPITQSINTAAQSANWNNISNKPNLVLANQVYGKQDTYTKNEVNNLFSTNVNTQSNTSDYANTKIVKLQTVSGSTVRACLPGIQMKHGNHTRDITVDNDGKVVIDGIIKPTDILMSSDKRLKEEIQPLDIVNYPLASIRGYKFKYHGKEGTHYGVLAQEVLAVYPELVKQDSLGYYEVNYIGLIPVLIEEIHQLRQDLNALKK
nr:MAG TPA: Neck appendage protein [Caudoviricetes sp.]